MIIKQLSIFVENRPGRMAEITEALAEQGVDIRALSLADTTDFGILRLIVNNPDAAITILNEAGVMVRSTEVIAVSVADRPGEFSNAVRVLSDAQVNIEYLYAFLSRTNNNAVIIFRVDDPQKAIDALCAKDIRLLQKAEVYNL